MKLKRLQQIRERVKSSLAQADKIMEGGDNYDGADGAREVQSLCYMAGELIDSVVIEKD